MDDPPSNEEPEDERDKPFPKPRPPQLPSQGHGMFPNAPMRYGGATRSDGGNKANEAAQLRERALREAEEQRQQQREGQEIQFARERQEALEEIRKLQQPNWKRLEERIDAARAKELQQPGSQSQQLNALKEEAAELDKQTKERLREVEKQQEDERKKLEEQHEKERREQERLMERFNRHAAGHQQEHGKDPNDRGR